MQCFLLFFFSSQVKIYKHNWYIKFMNISPPGFDNNEEFTFPNLFGDFS